MQLNKLINLAKNKELFFKPVIKYLVRFVVISVYSPVGLPGEEIIVFLTDNAYQKYKKSLDAHLVLEIEHYKYDENMCLVLEDI